LTGLGGKGGDGNLRSEKVLEVEEGPEKQGAEGSSTKRHIRNF